MSMLMQFLIGIGVVAFGWWVYIKPTRVFADWWSSCPNTKWISDVVRAFGVLAIFVGLANVGFVLTNKLPSFLGYLMVLVFAPLLTYLIVRPLNRSAER